jgi:TetR/AcrR family transcriptional regulator, fatty acid metabolism regulator protein
MGDGGNGNRRSFGPQGERRRAELMQAAVELAADQGFTRTRVSDIVGHVGVGQGVFYLYFESKEALFREILTDTTRRLRFFQGCYLAGEADPVRRIAKGIVATFDFIVHNAHVFALLDHASTQARFARQRTEVARVHGLDTARHVTEAMDNRVSARRDPMYISEAITGVIDRLARVYFASEARDLDGVIQEAVDFCLGGLLGVETVRVSELRAEVAMTSELRRLRDEVGAGDSADVPTRAR